MRFKTPRMRMSRIFIVLVACVIVALFWRTMPYLPQLSNERTLANMNGRYNNSRGGKDTQGPPSSGKAPNLIKRSSEIKGRNGPRPFPNVPHVGSGGQSGGHQVRGRGGHLERNETGSRVTFVPHPHRILGSGAQVQCQWETRSTANASKMDFTQSNAFNEGVCIPPALEKTIHVFSSVEAIECLSTAVQKREIRLIFSGDSYMKQLYIGTVDILLSKHVNGETEMTNAQERNEFVSVARQLVRKRLGAPNSTFPEVQYLCEHECYGKVRLDKCSECIDAFSGNNTGHVWVVGAGIHVMNRNMDGNNVTREQKTVQEISQFLDRESSKRVIFVSPPYFIHREDYKHQQTRMDRLYLNLMPYVAPQRPDHPFLDVHQLTKSCHMKNCSYDGNHRSRYVNRWKAQLLLNLLCQV